MWLYPFIVSIIFVSSALAQDEAPPDRVVYDEYPGPYWVSADSAVTAEGDLDYSLFPSPSMRRYRETHEKHFRLSKKAAGEEISWSECYQIERPICKAPLVRGRPQNSFDDLIRYSEAIFEGTIVKITPGFLGGHPTAMATVRVGNWIKVSPHFTKDGHLYMQYPVARFSIGGISYCVDNPDFPAEPLEGQQVLVFPFWKPWDEGRQFITVDPKLLFVTDHSGSLKKPKDLMLDSVAEQITTLSGMVDEVFYRLADPEIAREQRL